MSSHIYRIIVPSNFRSIVNAGLCRTLNLSEWVELVLKDRVSLFAKNGNISLSLNKFTPLNYGTGN